MVPLAPALPPWVVSFGVSPFSALEVPRGDRTLKDSQQSVVHHEQAPSQELERDRYPTVQGTVQAARTSKEVAPVANAATSVCVLAKPAVPSEVTAVSDHILPPVLWLVCVGLFLLFFFAEKVLFKTKTSTVCDVTVRTCMWRSSRSRSGTGNFFYEPCVWQIPSVEKHMCVALAMERCVSTDKYKSLDSSGR